MKLDWDLEDEDLLESPKQLPAADGGAFRRVMVVRRTGSGAASKDLWSALAGLRIQSDDKVYLHGVLNILQLPDDLAHELLLRYRAEWERAAKRCTNPNGIDNAGLRAANVWIQQGAPGFIQWEPDG